MPTFSISVENITEKETEVTENELKLINDELEKVPGAEGDGCNDSSGRNSHVSTGRNSYVSTGRSSHGSTITLSGKPLEGIETSYTQWKRFKWEQGILDQNRCRLLGVGALEGRRCILKCGYDILALNNRYRNRS